MRNKKQEQLLEAYEEYAKTEKGRGPVVLSDLANWAIRQGRWNAAPSRMRKQCERDFASMFRQRYVKDALGNKVRVMHAVRVKQGSLWDEIDSISRPMMQASLRQRRQQVVHDCYQMKVDKDHYNKLHSDEEPIQLVLDFTVDMLEMELAQKEKKKTRRKRKLEERISLN